MNYSNQKINAPLYPLISVIVLSYNRRADLQRTLTVLLQNSYPSLDIIVVDNASTDNSGEMVRTDFPTVKLIQLNTNIGIAGWNEGMKVASGEYFLCLDDDSYPLADSLPKVLPSLCQTKILSLTIITPSGQPDSPYFNTLFQQKTFIGCGVIIPRKVYDTIGGFEPLLFLYHHEIEYSIRAVEHNFSIQYLPDVFICHHRSDTNRLYLSGTDNRKAYYLARNSILVLLFHFPVRKIFGRLLRAIVGKTSFALYKGNFRIVVKGLYDGFNVGLQNKNKWSPVSVRTQKYFENGRMIGSFFGDGTYAFKRPQWL